MTALQKILVSDLSPETKRAAVEFEAALQWFDACLDAFIERCDFSPLN